MDSEVVHRMDQHFADVMKNFLIGIKESAREHDMITISANTDRALKGLQQMTRIRTQYVEKLVDSLEHKHGLEKNNLRLQNIQLFNENMVLKMQKFDQEMTPLTRRSGRVGGRQSKVPDCPVCLRTFDYRVAPHSGTCGHSVCQDCRRSLPAGDCPICREYGSFTTSAKNYLAQELIENISQESNQDETTGGEHENDGYETANEEDNESEYDRIESDDEEEEFDRISFSESESAEDWNEEEDEEDGVSLHYFLPDLFD